MRELAKFFEENSCTLETIIELKRKSELTSSESNLIFRYDKALEYDNQMALSECEDALSTMKEAANVSAARRENAISDFLNHCEGVMKIEQTQQK